MRQSLRCTDTSVRLTPPAHRRCTSASPSPLSESDEATPARKRTCSDPSPGLHDRRPCRTGPRRLRRADAAADGDAALSPGCPVAVLETLMTEIDWPFTVHLSGGSAWTHMESCVLPPQVDGPRWIPVDGASFSERSQVRVLLRPLYPQVRHCSAIRGHGDVR
jgi:hypothetical protein